MGSSVVGAIALAVIAASAAMLTGAYTGQRFAEPTPTITETFIVEPPGPEPVIEHTFTDVDAATAPTIEIDVTEDSDGGQYLRITTTNFVFTPDAVGGSHEPGEGHANVYVNDILVVRAYGSDVFVPDTEPGDVISVYLVANDLTEYAVEGVAIRAAFTVPGGSSPEPSPTASATP